jgi:hypothetical protein
MNNPRQSVRLQWSFADFDSLLYDDLQRRVLGIQLTPTAEQRTWTMDEYTSRQQPMRAQDGIPVSMRVFSRMKTIKGQQNVVRHQGLVEAEAMTIQPRPLFSEAPGRSHLVIAKHAEARNLIERLKLTRRTGTTRYQSKVHSFK